MCPHSTDGQLCELICQLEQFRKNHQRTEHHQSSAVVSTSNKLWLRSFECTTWFRTEIIGSYFVRVCYTVQPNFPFATLWEHMLVGVEIWIPSMISWKVLMMTQCWEVRWEQTFCCLTVSSHIGTMRCWLQLGGFLVVVYFPAQNKMSWRTPKNSSRTLKKSSMTFRK